jgi:hypothetical protein
MTETNERATSVSLKLLPPNHQGVPVNFSLPEMPVFSSVVSIMLATSPLGVANYKLSYSEPGSFQESYPTLASLPFKLGDEPFSNIEGEHITSSLLHF